MRYPESLDGHEPLVLGLRDPDGADEEVEAEDLHRPEGVAHQGVRVEAVEG